MNASYRLGLLAISLLYLLAGINHFVHPGTYIAIMPRWLPAPTLLVAVSGVAEMLLGALLLWEKTHRLAAWGIILLLVAVFPANIQMALDWHKTHHPYEWISWLRLPLQGVLIYWAWLYARKREKS